VVLCTGLATSCLVYLFILFISAGKGLGLYSKKNMVYGEPMPELTATAIHPLPMLQSDFEFRLCTLFHPHLHRTCIAKSSFCVKPSLWMGWGGGVGDFHGLFHVINKKSYQSVCPVSSRLNWVPPPLSPARECVDPPTWVRLGGGGHNSLAGNGVRVGTLFRRLDRNSDTL
jgi:hypothetical protein